MATTTHLPAGDVNSYDYVIVGGGTAGCVVASRLAQYLPQTRILLVEAGPSDYMDDRILNLREWVNLLGTELDYDYETVEQPMGMFHCFGERRVTESLWKPLGQVLGRSETPSPWMDLVSVHISIGYTASERDTLA
jgi:choline dehydrogenase-like flavoprotein